MTSCFPILSSRGTPSIHDSTVSPAQLRLMEWAHASCRCGREAQERRDLVRNLHTVEDKILFNGNCSIEFQTSLPEGFSVEGILEIKNSPINELPSGMEVKRLRIDGCRNLRETPADLKVDSLHIKKCQGLLKISDGLIVKERLHVCSCDALEDLPNDLKTKRLELLNCSRLAHIPESSQVDHLSIRGCLSLEFIGRDLRLVTLSVIDCPRIRQIADRVQVQESILIKQCLSLETIVGSRDTPLNSDFPLGGGLECGCIEVTNCPNILAFATKVRVASRCIVMNCESLLAVAIDLFQVDHLTLIQCASLTELNFASTSISSMSVIRSPNLVSIGGNGDSFQVTGCLELTETGITHLPAGLSVLQHLLLCYCRSLTALPHDIFVGGDLDLDGCELIDSLPSQILSYEEGEDDREISVVGTAITREYILSQRLASRGAIIGDGFTIYSGSLASEEDPENELYRSIAYWWDQDITEPWQLEPREMFDLKSFLIRLRDTAENVNPRTRPILEERVRQVLIQMDRHPEMRKEVVEQISDHLADCDDRVMHAFDQIEMFQKVSLADALGALELKSLALGFCRLEVVMKHAHEKIARLDGADHIEVILAYRTHLAKRLNLPVKTESMLFFGISDVTPADLEAAAQEAEQIDLGSEALAMYLKTWEPWCRYERRQLISSLSWDNLNSITFDPGHLEDSTCLFTSNSYPNQDPDSQPVCILLGETPYFFEFESLCRWWIKNGSDPILRRPMGVKQVKKAVFLKAER